MSHASAILPNALRITWHDSDGTYHSEEFADFAAADRLYSMLRSLGLRVGQKPLYNQRIAS